MRKVQIVAGIQSSKTFLMEIGTTYIVTNAPGPMLWLDQTDEEARDELENRLTPLWKSTPPVKDLLPGRTGKNRHRAKRNQMGFLNGMTAWVFGAHNRKNLQRRSIRWLIGDETWGWPSGHMAEAEARVTAFGWLGKVFFSSQAGEAGDDTDRSYMAGSQEVWHYSCLKCNLQQPYLWENVEWDKEAKDENGDWDFDKVKSSARVVCPDCQHPHDTNQIRIRNQMNDPDRGAGFVSNNPTAPSDYRSFHWNGLASTPVGTLATIYLMAKKSAKKGDLEPIKIFYQKRLAIPWRDYFEDFKMEVEASNYKANEDWDEEAIINRKGQVTDKPVIPDREDFDNDEDYDKEVKIFNNLKRGSIRGRTMTVDCQRDHFWVVVRSFNKNGDSRLIHWRGGREGDNSVLTWEDLDEIAETFNVAPRLVAVDAGYDTSRVYMETAKRVWTALMGDQRATFQHRIRDFRTGVMRSTERFYSSERRVNLGSGLVARVHYYSNLNIKDILARVSQNQDPDEGTTWEVPDNVDDLYLKQMNSEQRIQKGNKWVWKQIGKRPNHYWDCECMAITLFVMLKLLGRESVADGDSQDDIAPPEDK